MGAPIRVLAVDHASPPPNSRRGSTPERGCGVADRERILELLHELVVDDTRPPRRRPTPPARSLPWQATSPGAGPAEA